MRYPAAAALVLTMTFATTAQAQSFVGEWTATAHLDGGLETSETLTVTKLDSGYAITGKAIGAPPGMPEAGPATEVVLEGDNFSYKRTLNTGGSGIEITYAGTVSGDTFTGTAELTGTKVPYTGTRVQTRK